MATITNIKPQVKRSDRFSIYLDNNYAFSLSDIDLAVTKLEIGQQLDQAKIEELQGLSAASKAYERALKYISYRMRSVAEVRKYLTDKGYGEVEVDDTVSRLSSVGLLDDQAFAEAWVANRQAVKPKSKLQLAIELRQKGLDELVIEAVLNTLDESDESAAIKKIAQKKSAQIKYREPRKLTEYLTRQGFSYYRVKETLAELGITDS